MATSNDHVVDDNQFLHDVKKIAETYNLNPQDGKVFSARAIDHEPSLDPSQLSSAIPDTGLKDHLSHSENGNGNGVHPSKYLPHISGPREEGMPSDVLGGYAEEPAQAQEGARGRGPGMHEQNLSHIPVEGQGPNPQPDYGADGTLRQNPDGTRRPVPLNQPPETDELGRTTKKMPGVKEEEPPGPRTDICLAPRIVHLQVSQ